MDAGEVKQFFLPYDKECMLGVGMNRVGVVDTYGRNSWCSRKQMVRARRRYLVDFGPKPNGGKDVGQS